MELSQQVVSLELAKRLKELGVKQDSWFWHQEYKNKMVLLDDVPDEHADNYSAFTVAELGEMLPVYVTNDVNKTCYQILICASDAEYLLDEYNEPTILERPRMCQICYCALRDENEALGAYSAEDASEANARAKMLIWLIENGHVKP